MLGFLLLLILLLILIQYGLAHLFFPCHASRLGISVAAGLSGSGPRAAAAGVSGNPDAHPAWMILVGSPGTCIDNARSGIKIKIKIKNWN